MKTLLLVVFLLAGCASSQTEKSYQAPDMKNFAANCNIARVQIDYLNKEIDAYNNYFKNNPTTIEDRRAYGRMKNAVWSLRSSCSAKQL